MQLTNDEIISIIGRYTINNEALVKENTALKKENEDLKEEINKLKANYDDLIKRGMNNA